MWQLRKYRKAMSFVLGTINLIVIIPKCRINTSLWRFHFTRCTAFLRYRNKSEAVVCTYVVGRVIRNCNFNLRNVLSIGMKPFSDRNCFYLSIRLESQVWHLNHLNHVWLSVMKSFNQIVSLFINNLVTIPALSEV